LDEIIYDVDDFHGFASMQDEISFTSCTLARNGMDDDRTMQALSTLHLVESNPHVKKLVVIEGGFNTLDSRIFGHLGKHCCEVKEVVVYSQSAEAVRLAMASFPILSSLTWECHSRSFSLPTLLGEMNLYPNIESFYLNISHNLGAAEITSLIKACPNLKHLECHGPWMFQGLHEVLASCNMITILVLNYDDDVFYNPTSILSAIAEHGLQLKEWKLKFDKIEIDLRNSSTRSDLTRTMKRLRSFQFYSRFVFDDVNLDRSICSMFSSSDVDLRSFSVMTYTDDADRIAMMFQCCRNADRLGLRGSANISQVMMKVSDSCRQLVDLSLAYDGRVDGLAMRSLLQTCPLLKTLAIQASLSLQAFEYLVIYGGNLTELALLSWIVGTSMYGPLAIPSFDMSSPLYDINLKQRRKHPMNRLVWRDLFLDVKSVAKFLSFFGVIDDLYLEMGCAQLPTDISAQNNEEIPIIHAHRMYVSVNHSSCVTYNFGPAFLMLMNSCRSMRALFIASKQNYPNNCFIDASTLIACITMCSRVNLLTSLSYPEALRGDLSPLVKLTPKLKRISHCSTFASLLDFLPSMIWILQ
jgi:hypothetical protein